MIKDYWKMYRARGFQKIIKYFFEAHLYDWVNNINSHYRYINKTKTISKNSYSVERDKKNLISYQVTWTSEIKKIFKSLDQYFQKNSMSLKDYTFVDAGSGKGKVLIEWFNQVKKLKIKQKIIGVEIDNSLHKVAKENLSRLGFEKKITLMNLGILKYKFAKKKYIIYIYNSFSREILKRLIKKLKNKKIIIIYCNPQFSSTLKKNNFKDVITWKNKKFNNLTSTIFSNHL